MLKEDKELREVIAANCLRKGERLGSIGTLIDKLIQSVREDDAMRAARFIEKDASLVRDICAAIRRRN